MTVRTLELFEEPVLMRTVADIHIGVKYFNRGTEFLIEGYLRGRRNKIYYVSRDGWELFPYELEPVAALELLARTAAD